MNPYNEDFSGSEFTEGFVQEERSSASGSSASISSSTSALGRRELLKAGAAALAGGGAAMLGGERALAQVAAQNAAATAVPTKMAGTKYRAYVRHAGGQTDGVETLTLRPIQARQVIVRTQAAQACYTLVGILAPAPPPAPPAAGAAPNPAAGQAAIQGHGGVGIVMEVGPEVKRVQVGDRVIVPVTANCGQCWNCLRGRGDACTVAAGRPNPPVADMPDGSPAFGTLAGMSEYMVAWEEQTVPIVSDSPAEQLSLLSCVGTVGLGLSMRRFPVEAGSDVVVLGAGPLGLSAVQGARIQGAAQIIVVEPVSYRRDLAMKVGATAVIDPNVDKGMDLITKIRTMCKSAQGIERSFGGGRGPNVNAYGPMYVLEAVGGDRFPPKVEAGPDPTGVGSLQLAWNLCPTGGFVRTCGVGQPMGSMVAFPAGQWSNATKTHVPGNFAGVNTLRDIPEFVRLIESKRYDAASLVGQIFTIEQARQSFQVAADRTAITGIVKFA